MEDISNLTVAVCVEDFPPYLAGGGGRSNSILASALAEKCKLVIVFHLMKGSLKTYEMTGLRCVEVKKDVASYRNIDVIQVCGRVNPTLVTTILAKSFAPVIFTSRSNAKALDRLGTRPVVVERNRKQDEMMEIASAIVACSETEASELRLDYSKFADKILSIHNAIDPKLIQALGRDSTNFRVSKGPKFAFLGRFRTHKGILDLLSASERLWREGYVFNLKLVGGHIYHGEDAVNSKLTQACQFWSNCVERVDWINDPVAVATVYKSTHCVIIPSHYEPFGLVALEAISAGCYVIASNVGGLSETLTNVSCAQIYSREDVFALEKEMRQFISGGLWKEMNTSGCAEKIRGQFTPERMTSKYVELYARLLKKI